MHIAHDHGSAHLEGIVPDQHGVAHVNAKGQARQWLEGLRGEETCQRIAIVHHALVNDPTVRGGPYEQHQ